MHSKEELAQPVGNAKIRGEFDTDAATATGPNDKRRGSVSALTVRSRRQYDRVIPCRNGFGKAVQNLGKDRGGQF